ncbi:hypothetical protein BGW37DRAFT_523055 [Umbelopsis sp. PMI_123]|nr:hypothetical protein BGW37DRAFT_523055 [Umbelopsis sp. PMI_123]
MATANHCPSCGADASHRQVDVERASLVYCTNCGNVLEDTEYQHVFIPPPSVPNITSGKQKSATSSNWRHFPKSFELSNGTCVELERLASPLQLTEEDLQTGYSYIRQYIKERALFSTRITAVAVGYLLRRMKLKPMPLRACALLCQASSQAVGIEYRRLVNVLKLEFPQGYWDPFLFLNDAAVLNYEVLALQQNKKVKSFTLPAMVNIASGIANAAMKPLYHTGRSSTSFIVSCLLLASDVLNEAAISGSRRNKILKQIAAMNNISQHVLEKRYIELRKFFSNKMENLPWKAGKGKCKDPTPFIRDLLELEDVLPPKPSAEDVEFLETQVTTGKIASETVNPPTDQGLESETNMNNSYYPPAFIKAEETRQHLKDNIERVIRQDLIIGEAKAEDAEDMHTLAFLLGHGWTKEDLLNTTELDRKRLEHTIQYREQFPRSYNAQRDLDKVTLDDDDLCEEEVNIYLRTS